MDGVERQGMDSLVLQHDLEEPHMPEDLAWVAFTV